MVDPVPGKAPKNDPIADPRRLLVAQLLGERVAGRHEGGGVARVERVDAGVGAGQSQSQNSE